MGERPVVTLYGRPGCHLCDAAEADLRELAPTLGFAIELVNIETNDALLQRYLFEIPVVTLGDVEVAKAPIRGRMLEDRLWELLRT
ncbi:MAG: glutaredoxin family protein [Dehalococcoidia bacterium]|nr:glutaredoxin family protein [Dehalococcoidia bacterium]